MTREYEIVYIFDSTLEEAQVNERLERFHGLLECPESSEPISGINHWGRRTLAYDIDGKDVGYYVVVQFETRPDLLGELERALKLDEAVLRYLVVLNEGLVPVTAAAPEESEPETPDGTPESTTDGTPESTTDGTPESTTDGAAEQAANKEDEE
ncbi:MAG: 30S ribosomal protein S6 [Gemmatimonadota bacterium]